MSTDRWDFLKASAAAAGTAVTANLAGAFAAGNDSIKVGLIGCGGRGTGAVHDMLEAEAIIASTRDTASRNERSAAVARSSSVAIRALVCSRRASSCSW